MVNLLISEQLADIRYIKHDESSTLIRLNGCLATPFKQEHAYDAAAELLLSKYGLIASRAKGIFEAALMRIKANKDLEITPPKSVAFEGDGQIAWVILERKTIQLTDIPEFELFLSQTDEQSQRSLVLFLGSLLDDNSSRKQYLHLFGHGGEGKSTLLDAITKAFKGRAVGLTASRLQGSHFGSELEGNRLYLFCDENNSGFFSSGNFKSLTGDNSLTINPKFEKPRTITLTGKVVVCSNAQIEIQDNHADRSRIISIELENKEKELGWHKGFLDKGLDMLLYCYQEYLDAVKATPSIRNIIPCNQANTQRAIERKTESLEDIFNDHFEVEASGKIKRSDVMKVFSSNYNNILNNRARDEIKRFLASKDIQEVKNNDWYFYGIQIKLDLNCEETTGDKVKSISFARLNKLVKSKGKV